MAKADGPMFAKRSRPFGSSRSVMPETGVAQSQAQPMVSDGSSADSVTLHLDAANEHDQRVLIERKIAKKLRKLERKARKRELKAKRELGEKVEKARRKLERKALRKQRKLERKAESDLAEYERWMNALRRPISVRHNSRSDCLLSIGGDSMLSVLSFLDMKSLAMAELVCDGMKNQARRRYESIDAQIKSNKSRARTAKKRAIRYYLASTYAREMEPLVPRHLASAEDETEHVCTGGDRCQFPSSLFTNPSPDTHELFVRFAKNTVDNSESPQFVVEGFTKFVLDGSRVIFDIGDMDLSTWPEMRSVLNWNLDAAGVNGGGGGDISDDVCNDDAPPFHHLMKTLVATVVAVDGFEKVVLVNATHNDPADANLDHYHLPTGCHSFCTTNDLRTAPHSTRCNATFNFEFVWSYGGKLECHLATLR